MEIEKKVLLLAIYKKQEGETLNDVVLQLENNRVFTLKEGKKMLKDLKSEGYLTDGALTFSGIAKAQEAEAEFKL